MAVRLETSSPEETEALGTAIGRCLHLPWVVALDGELGTGKTRLVHGLAKGLGLHDAAISSSSFVLAVRHDGPTGSLAHLDAYRLEGVHALESIGFEEMLQDPSLGLAIEWASRIESALPRERLDVRLEHVGETTRAFEIDDHRSDEKERERLRESVTPFLG